MASFGGRVDRVSEELGAVGRLGGDRGGGRGGRRDGWRGGRRGSRRGSRRRVHANVGDVKQVP